MYGLGKVRFDFVLGYRILTPASGEEKNFLSSALRLGISVEAIDASHFKISERDFKAVKSDGLISEGYTVSEPYGLAGLKLKFFRRYGVIFALFLSSILVFLSSTTVFDVRVRGCENLNDNEILEILEQSGLRVGASWFSLNLSETEGKILDSCDEISWVNVNRRGNVAYVDVIEKKSTDEAVEYDYCNIVATVDCVIEDISVKRGYAVVKKGDTVKCGDILISGVPQNGLGGFCMADGVVVGRVNQTISVCITSETEEKQVLNEYKRALALKIFNFSINIFNFSGNSIQKCDIIERKTDFTLFGKKIPISVSKSYDIEYASTRTRRTEGDMISLASEQTALLISEIVQDAELLKMRSRGRFSEFGYELTTDLVILSDIGESVPFEVG